MSVTTYNAVDTQELVQTFWSPIVEKELRENTLFPALLQDPNYTLEAVKGGSTIKYL